MTRRHCPTCDFCPEPGFLVTAMCKHEHQVGVNVCDRHAEDMRRGWIYCRICDRDVSYPHSHMCPLAAVVPVVRFDGGEPPHRVHFPTRPGWRWGWCDCPIGEDHNDVAVSQDPSGRRTRRP